MVIEVLEVRYVWLDLARHILFIHWYICLPSESTDPTILHLGK